ncbi:hypothetical protein X275_04660 [Marinitoga sp. 1197]|uniref:hypothetical protein n=1 Tax=Marinitoga sp. 1197 TaxID=1428449 RepID=UPI000640E1D9|nr:hypothetical protein [Marinitoga sp. 1197]KLO22850.1 hypothetical protein X275_04660 [Marinitoga sp. 1197]
MKKRIIIILLLLSSYVFSENILNYYLNNFDKLNKAELNKILNITESSKNGLNKIIHGSVLVKKAKHEWFLPLKYYYLYSGMLEMKEVVKENFDNLIYRYIRGKTAFEILSYDFARKIFINDFEYIYIRVNDDFKNKFDFGEVLYKLYRIYELDNKEKAKSLLKKLKEYPNYYRLIYYEK